MTLPNDAIDLIRRLPLGIKSDPVYSYDLVELWRKIPKQDLSQEEFLSLWDDLWSSFVTNTKDDPIESRSLNFAINDSGGKMVESLISYLWPKDAKVGSGLPAALTKRVEKICDRADQNRLDASSVIVISRLSVFHAVDPNFTEARLVPLLNWNTHNYAADYWDAYLWYGRLTPDLFKAIEEYFYEALNRQDSLQDEAYKKLNQMFVLASMDMSAVEQDNISYVLRNANISQLEYMSAYIRQRSLNSKAESKSFWTKTLMPWMDKYWPRDQAKRSEKISENLVLASLYSGEFFPAALEWLEDNHLLMELPTCSMILSALRERDDSFHEDFANSYSLPDRYPSEILRLLSVTKPFRWDHGEARRILNRLIANNDVLRDSQMYVNLDMFVRR